MSSALITIGSIAGAAAITTGLLILAGVGDDKSGTGEEASSREQEINRAVDDLAADSVREAPELCGVVSGTDGTGGFVDVSINWRVLGDSADLSEGERQIFSGRFAESLREECEARTR